MTSQNPLRRCFGTIHRGNLDENNLALGIRGYFDSLEERLTDDGRFLAGAFALEYTKAGNLHVQFYCEHSRMRPTTLAGVFGLDHAQVFEVVKSANGSWDYCTGTKAHENKPAEARFSFGTPKLHGDTQQSDLRMLVEQLMSGAHPLGLLRSHPYAYTVHRSRIWALYRDLQHIEKYGTLTDEIVVDDKP